MNTDKKSQYNRDYSKKYYSIKENKVTHRADIKERLLRIKTKLQEYKSTLKCEICGENHLACIDFHHLDPSKKERGISRTVFRGWNWERIYKEIEKCRVLCSNCHKKLHYDLKEE